MGFLKCQGERPSWCGQCYSNKKGRSNYRGHFGYRAPPPMKVESLAMVLKRRDAAAAAVGSQGKLAPSKWGLAHPLLWEMLTQDQWEDGTPRKLATLTIFLDEGLIKLSLNDRAQGLVGFVTGPSVEEALRTLEAQLKDDRVEWRKSFQDFSKSKKK